MATYYVGWDVGAWQCKENSKSHDAIAVFDERFELVSYGCGNVKDKLRGSKDFAEFLSKFTKNVPDKKNFPLALVSSSPSTPFWAGRKTFCGW